jgi:hypothetical protein
MLVVDHQVPDVAAEMGMKVYEAEPGQNILCCSGVRNMSDVPKTIRDKIYELEMKRLILVLQRRNKTVIFRGVPTFDIILQKRRIE